MVGLSSVHRYGPQAERVQTTQSQAVGPPGISEASKVLRRSIRNAWEDPALEATRSELQAGAARAGIAGHTGSYARAAEVTGFARELSRLAGPKETGVLAEHFKRAWGKHVDLSPLF